MEALVLVAAGVVLMGFAHLYTKTGRVLSTNKGSIGTNGKSYLPEITAYTLELERKQREYLEVELKHSEQYRTLVSIIPDIVYILDKDGKFEYIKNAEQIGWTDDGLIGVHFSKILRPDYIEKVSREHVLKKHRGEKTEPKQPGLFDERRGPPRVTRRLPVVLVPKSWEEGKKVPGNYAYISSCGMVHSGGIWDKPLGKLSQFAGTIGIIEVVGTAMWEEDDE